ncbi:MAG: RNA polymerase sigma factor [Gaiellaceae bacterium]
MESRPPEERELVLRAQRGDARAFEELVRPYWEVAFRVGCVVAGDATEAEDAAQEALLKAWRAISRFRPGAPFRPWLLRIVANEARNRRRSAGRRLRLELRAQQEVAPGGAAPSPEAAALAGDERRRLLDALETLPEQARSILVCRFLLELSELETATVLGVRPGTVKSRTARALARLTEIHD